MGSCVDDCGNVQRYLATNFEATGSSSSVNATRLHLLLRHEAHVQGDAVAFVQAAFTELGWRDVTFEQAQGLYSGMQFKVPFRISAAVLPMSAPTKLFLRHQVAEKTAWVRKRHNRHCAKKGWTVEVNASGITGGGDGLFATKNIERNTYICDWEGTPVHASHQKDRDCTPSLRPSGKVMDPKSGNLLTSTAMANLVGRIPGVLAYVDLSESSDKSGSSSGEIPDGSRTLIVNENLNLVLDPSGKINPAAKANDKGFVQSDAEHESDAARGSYRARSLAGNNAGIHICLLHHGAPCEGERGDGGGVTGGTALPKQATGQAFGVQLWSTADIKAGDEIFTAYGSDYWHGRNRGLGSFEPNSGEQTDPLPSPAAPPVAPPLTGDKRTREDAFGTPS